MKQETAQGFRLSPQQERLWFLQQDGSSLYRAQCAVLLEGDFDTTRFEMALQAVIDRHEILRTSFQFIPGMVVPVQVIADSQTVLRPLEYNLSDLAAEEQQRSVDQFFREE